MHGPPLVTWPCISKKVLQARLGNKTTERIFFLKIKQKKKNTESLKVSCEFHFRRMVPLLSTVNYRIVLKEKMNTLETRHVDFIFFFPLTLIFCRHISRLLPHQQRRHMLPARMPDSHQPLSDCCQAPAAMLLPGPDSWVMTSLLLFLWTWSTAVTPRSCTRRSKLLLLWFTI